MNDKRLTKADILQGKDAVHEIEVAEWGGSVSVRPLTEGEYAQVEALKGSCAKLGGGAVYDEEGNVDRLKTAENMSVEMDMQQYVQKEFEGNVMAVAFAMSIEEEWTAEEVKRLKPPGVVAKIAYEVYSLSGVSGGLEAIQKFRQGSRGATNRKSSSKRNAAGENAI